MQSNISHNIIIIYYYSGIGSNCVLQGPPIQVVGVALMTEFSDHNYSFKPDFYEESLTYILLKIERKHTQGFCIKPDYWRDQVPLLKYWGAP